MSTIYRLAFRLSIIVGSVGIFLATAGYAYAGTPLVESVRATNQNTVVITYSEAVYTTLNDYGTFTGSLAGSSLVSVSGSGTNLITLIFSGSPFAYNTSAGLTIASTVHSVADGYAVGSGPYNIIDGITPILASFSVTSNLSNGTFARTGDALTVSFTTSEPVSTASATIDGHMISTSGSGSGPYTASYTLTSSDTQDTVPVSITFTDSAGNSGNGAFLLGEGLGPRIVSITSDATSPGVLTSSGTINFILTLSSPAPNAYINGSYDGVPLTWSTNNGGATYTATFTVQDTDPSTSAPLQITNVTVRDSSGNVSSPASGSDIQKTINSQSFLLSSVMPVSSPVPSGTSPRFGFYTPQDGTVTYGGSCTSAVLTAVRGNTYVTFNPLPDGVYSNCTITVTDQAGYQSKTLAIPSFTVGGAGLASVIPVTTTPTVVSTPIVTSDVSSTDGYKFYKPLDVGSTGTDVTELQKRLTADGWYSGPITGRYGALTQAAVKKYQKAYGLKQLGNVGPSTRALLNKGA